MRFLVDACLPRATASLLHAHGHEAVDARDLRMGTAPDPVISDYAIQHGLCLVTIDTDFGDIRNYPPEKHSGIVVLRPAPDPTAESILHLLKTFLEQPQIVGQLHGHLAIVSVHQVRFRPA